MEGRDGEEREGRRVGEERMEGRERGKESRKIPTFLHHPHSQLPPSPGPPPEWVAVELTQDRSSPSPAPPCRPVPQRRGAGHCGRCHAEASSASPL